MMHVMNAHMMHALMHKNLFNFTKFTNNWLKQKSFNQKKKKPKIWKTHFSKPNQIDQLNIILVRKQHIMA